jgi:hypothetical protein
MLENNNVNASRSVNLLYIFNTLFSLVQIYPAIKHLESENLQALSPKVHGRTHIFHERIKMFQALGVPIFVKYWLM